MIGTKLYQKVINVLSKQDAENQNALAPVAQPLLDLQEIRLGYIRNDIHSTGLTLSYDDMLDKVVYVKKKDEMYLLFKDNMLLKTTLRQFIDLAFDDLCGKDSKEIVKYLKTDHQNNELRTYCRFTQVFVEKNLKALKQSKPLTAKI